MLSKLDDYLRFNEMELNLRAKRQEVLTSNVANADTPNYKARDIDFKQVLQDKISQPTKLFLNPPPLSLDKTDQAHFSATHPTTDIPVLYRQARQPSADGNTVDMDVERTQIADNSLHYEAGISDVSGKIKGLLSIIQG